MTNEPAATIAQSQADSDGLDTKKVTQRCSCHVDVSVDQMRDAFPHASVDNISKYLDELNRAMRKYDINTCLRKMHFLAQLGHESGQLRHVVEQGISDEVEKKRYGGYKGRGLIQLTHKDMYQIYFDFIGQELTSESKKILEQPQYASDSAGWFWRYGKGEQIKADADRNDMILLSARINGGFNGYQLPAVSSRLDLLCIAARALRVTLCQHIDSREKARLSMAVFDQNTFPLALSEANDMRVYAFAWGLWHDPNPAEISAEFSSRKESTPVIKHGVKKSRTEAINGYSRYVTLAAKISQTKLSRVTGLYGFSSATAMLKYAEARMKALGEGERQ